jgi:2-oxoglutarate ferredoxin oxidoreductase subunit delta
MSKIEFKSDVCKGCGLCVTACPKHIVALDEEVLNVKGHHPAKCIDEAACVACASCAMMCPDCVITING